MAFKLFIIDKLIGALIAAGVTYRTADIASSWSWRLPCLLQALFSVLCLIILFFVPESPRWLVHRGRLDDALVSLASTHSDSNITDPFAIEQHRLIVDSIATERALGRQMTYGEIFRTPNSRRRLLLVVSVAVLSMSSGQSLLAFGKFPLSCVFADRVQEITLSLIIWVIC